MHGIVNLKKNERVFPLVGYDFLLSLAMGKEKNGFVHPCVRAFMQVGVCSKKSVDEVKTGFGFA